MAHKPAYVLAKADFHDLNQVREALGHTPDENRQH